MGGKITLQAKDSYHLRSNKGKGGPPQSGSPLS